MKNNFVIVHGLNQSLFFCDVPVTATGALISALMAAYPTVVRVHVSDMREEKDLPTHGFLIRNGEDKK